MHLKKDFLISKIWKLMVIFSNFFSVNAQELPQKYQMELSYSATVFSKLSLRKFWHGTNQSPNNRNGINDHVNVN